MQVLSEEKRAFFFLYVCNEMKGTTLHMIFFPYVAIDVTKLHKYLHFKIEAV